MTEAALIIRAAGPDDCRFYWTVNNDPTTRAVSMSTAPIPWASHATWYPARLSDPLTHLYVAEHGGVPVGVVRFDLEGEDATISVALAPEHQGKGLGRRIIAQATEKTLVILLLGGTGVGKSTFLNALAGQPIAGTSHAIRAYTHKLNLFHHREASIGFLTQGLEDRFETVPHGLTHGP